MSRPTTNLVITGATGGLGSALALACAARGARVILLDRKRRPLEALCEQIETLGAPAPAFADFDLTSVAPDSLKDLVQQFSSTFGGIHGLVHCAARFEALRPLEQTPPEEWLLDIQVNLNAAWLLSVVSLPFLRQHRGKLVFILDQAVARGRAYWGGYGVAKAALKCLAEMFSEELEGNGAEVMAYDPGPMRTDLRSAAFLGEDPEASADPTEAAEQLANLLCSPAEN